MSKTAARSSHQEDWHRQDILAAIRKKGSTIAELARLNGYTNSRTLYHVFNNPYPKAEGIIAKFLEIPASEIWPSRYESQPNIGYSSQSTTAPRRRQVA